MNLVSVVCLFAGDLLLDKHHKRYQDFMLALPKHDRLIIDFPLPLLVHTSLDTNTPMSIAQFHEFISDYNRLKDMCMQCTDQIHNKKLINSSTTE